MNSYLDTNYLISGSSDSKVKIWNHQISKQSLFELKTGHTDSIKALAYQNRLHYLAIGSKDKTFSLWKRRNEYEAVSIQTIDIQSPLHALAILPNSNIVCGRDNSTIKICQSKYPFKCIANLFGHTDFVITLVILPNSNILSGSYDSTISGFLLSIQFTQETGTDSFPPVISSICKYLAFASNSLFV